MTTEHDLDKDLDELEEACSQLVSLLRDRHVGLMSWRHLIGCRAKTVRESMEKLGMIDKEAK